MIRRFFNSRGWGKLRRNRLAMVSLAVIGCYFALAIWMMSMDVVSWVGKKTDAWDLAETPVLGAFLAERMLEQSGPPSVAGLGKPIGMVGRLDYIDFFFSRARTAVDEASNVGESSDRTVTEVLDSFSVQERRLLDLPLPDLIERVEEGESILGRLDDARSLVNAAETIKVQLDVASTRLAELAAAGEEDDLSILQEEAAFGVEEIIFAIDDYQAVAGRDDAFGFEVVDQLQEVADLLFDGESEVPELAAVFDEIRSTANAEALTQADGVETLLPEAEAFVDTLMPVPDGIAGLSYNTRLLFGTDRQGRSILIRALYSAKIAIQVGFIVGLTAVLIGSLLGAAAAFFGGIVDHGVTWLYSIFSSIPQLVLLAVLSFMFVSGPLQEFRGLPSLYMAFALTYWIGPCRVIRGEAMKIKELEYVQAATAIGFGRFYILIKHIIPNTLHLMFINFSLLFVGAIKGEVILTFLGLGLPLGDGASWGIMISQAKSEVVQGFFWQIGAATLFMFILVLAFNILSDALQDAFDPKHVG
ncbi:MAG: ABC transporter permease [Planctomycetota bacterium]